MPALGVAQTSGAPLRWLKAEGDAVPHGEALMEIEIAQLNRRPGARR